MAALYEILAELVRESGISQTLISTSTGVDKAEVSRILKGKRDPKKEFLNQLCDILCLPALTRVELSEQFERERIGALYDQHMAVCRILTRISQIDLPHATGGLAASISDIDRSIGTNSLFSNAYDVVRLISSLVHNACEKGDGFTIRLCCPFDFTALFDIISRYHNTGAHFTVEHLVRLEQRSTEGTARNLSVIGDLIPFNYISRDYYTAYYYYGSSRELDDIYTPYPYYVIIDNQLILLSRYFADAVLITEPDVVRGFETSFRYCITANNDYCMCVPLISYTDSADNIYDYFARQVSTSMSKPSSFTHVLMSTPPLCPVFTPEEIAAHARTDIPNIAQLAERLVQLRHTLTDTVHDPNCFYVFSLEGLDRFLETGETIEYPPGVLSPFTLEERLRLIDTYMQLVREGKYYLVADTSKLSIPANMMARTLQNGTIDFLIYDTETSPYGTTTITLDEKSLHSAFMSFCEYLPESSMVLRPDDTYECLWRRREHFSKRHGFE